jgi:hypothetical protein
MSDGALPISNALVCITGFSDSKGDDDKCVHPCNGESAFKGFEIVMAICRSGIEVFTFMKEDLNCDILRVFTQQEMGAT